MSSSLGFVDSSKRIKITDDIQIENKCSNTFANQTYGCNICKDICGSRVFTCTHCMTLVLCESCLDKTKFQSCPTCKFKPPPEGHMHFVRSRQVEHIMEKTLMACDRCHAHVPVSKYTDHINTCPSLEHKCGLYCDLRFASRMELDTHRKEVVCSCFITDVDDTALIPAPAAVLPAVRGLHAVERPISIGTQHNHSARQARHYVNTQRRQTKFEDLTVGCMIICFAHDSVSNDHDNRSFIIDKNVQHMLYLCRVDNIFTSCKEVVWKYMCVNKGRYSNPALRLITKARASKSETWFDGDTQRSIFNPDVILLHWVEEVSARASRTKARSIPAMQVEALKDVLQAFTLNSNILAT
jgi:hypothetical protein